MGEIFADAAYSLHRFADICLCDGWDRPKVVGALNSGCICFFWYRKYLSRKGKYVEQFCVLRFSPGKLEWEYPHMCIEGTSRKIYVICTILSQDIQEIALSHEMRSVKIDSKPVMVTVERGKEKTTDFRKQNKKCTLILYSCL